MSFSEFEQRRLELYIAGVSSANQPQRIASPNIGGLILCSTCESRGSITKRYKNAFGGDFQSLYKNYTRQAQALFAEVAPRSCFSVFSGDSRIRFESPTIIKSRLVKDSDAQGVLLPLDRKHHWNALLDLKNDDRPYEDKDDKLIWRGVTTGIFQRKNISDVYSQRFHVASLTNLANGIDIKYSEIVQIDDDTSDVSIDIIRSRLGPKMSTTQQLASKFILCLEGNDVATGLKWMMASNSTVVMPAPTCETWFCEGELQPWVHYVPVKQDLSDINEIYEWCLSNQKACKDIAFNGKQYIKQFLEYTTEKNIIREVINTYLDNSDETLNYSIHERIKQKYNYITLLAKAHKFSKVTEKWKQCI